MTGEAFLENGMAKIGAGAWLMAPAQPVACFGTAVRTGLKGFIVPDRAALKCVTTVAEAWCAEAVRPFLVRLTALPDETLHAVSAKVLVAPVGSRAGAKGLKLVPFSLRRRTPVTEFRQGWVVMATRSRVTRVAVEEGQTLTVRPEALVAWQGREPTGFCPKLSVMDMLLPRGPRNLAYSFHGPAVVWFEGGEELVLKWRKPYGVRP